MLRQERPTMESDVYGFAMILWYLAARKTDPFLPLQKERAFMAIVDGKVSYMCTLLLSCSGV